MIYSNIKDFFEAQNRVSQEVQKIIEAPKKAFLEVQDRQARSVQEIQKALGAPARQARLLKELSGLSSLS